MRTRGAIAGLVPSLVIALWFAWSGTTASPSEVTVSLGLVALITSSAGWLAAPLAAGARPRITAAAIGYAIAVMGTNATLAVMQAASDSIGANGLDPVDLMEAVVGRAAVAVVSTAYLIVPALIAGCLWSLAAHALAHLVRRTPTVLI